jgi:hypothetical protein
MTPRERCHHRQPETIGQQLGDRLLGDLESVLARVIREIGVAGLGGPQRHQTGAWQLRLGRGYLLGRAKLRAQMVRERRMLQERQTAQQDHRRLQMFGRAAAGARRQDNAQKIGRAIRMQGLHPVQATRPR